MPAVPYAHRLAYLHAADVHALPYLGGPEDRLRLAFANSYGQLRAYMRTPHFADQLDLTSAARAMNVIDEHLLDAQVAFHTAALPTFEKVCHGGAALERTDFHARDDDARAMTKASTEPEPSRFRFRATGRRAAPAPRLYGLRPTPVPRPRHSFNADARHIEAAKSLSLNLVTHVTRTQRAKIRTVVTQSITRGINVVDTGTRVSNIVGLFPRWQTAVNNLYARMLDNDIPKHIADQRVRDYADELLEKRGIMIARTELMRAMNDGRLAGWHDLADDGYLDPKTAIKEWHGSIDNDICPECEYLSDPRGDGVGMRVVGLDALFDTDFGQIAMPPAHPHCRCTVLMTPDRTASASSAGSGPDADDEAIANDPEIANLRDNMA